MPAKKTKKQVFPWLRTLIIGLLVGLSIILSQLYSRQQSLEDSQFSSESLQALKELNFEYKMYIEDLYAAEEDSSLVSELFMADALFTTKKSPNVGRGLIASWKTEFDAGVLLLQPGVSLSELELQMLAKEYAIEIPEFNFVEIDQDIVLSGEPYFWGIDPGQSPVILSEESAISGEDGEEAFVQEKLGTVDPLRIAVIDSGVDGTHEIFNTNQVEEGWNAISEEPGGQNDDVGHGTHVSGIIASNIPGAYIVPYKIVDVNGGTLSNVISAFNKAIDDDVDIINASFGVLSPSHSLLTLMKEAYEKNIIVVAAAGNNNSDSGFYPATYDEYVIGVGSVDKDGNKMPKSNYGSWVDVVADGYYIWSSLPNQGYGYKSGTSQAAPFVAATVAKIRASARLQNTLTFEEVMLQLLDAEHFVEEGELADLPIIE